ncbi:general secretion pathway protein GspN [Pseudomonas guariconensis]|uniref:general secretion pathway protein GspN n=1 Tax=Pseudomonas guariconensis TaxID=1288410 RepID=UPI0018A9BFEC|nr:general secretion pathway protein GspN [Pseudomonas guariconensis]MBF8721642.1 general secretion pathway protein GspN [Pseudomonas guariconensis]
MTRRGWVWLVGVFCLTVLVELPAGWVLRGLALPVAGVSGSLWRGEARQLGEVGPVRWHWRPWHREIEAGLAFQGQGWRVRLAGWPWQWQAELEALGPQASVASAYRLAGQWQGLVRLQGNGSRCHQAQGRLAVEDLALAAPWSLGLGQGSLEVECDQGWRVLGRLALAGQHSAELKADLLGRQAQVDLHVQQGAAVTPLLRGARWLGPEATRVQRLVKW